MRKITFSVANSLDNFIARPDHSADWLMWSDEAGEVMAEFWPKVDTILMGRKTYDIAMQSKPGDVPVEASSIKTYVFSRTLPPSQDPAVEIVANDAAGFVKKLKQSKGKEICLMGGGDFARTLFEADLIDEIGLNTHPVLLGAGIPLFHALPRQVNLALVDSKTFKNGCVYLTYRVKHGRGRKPAE